MEKRMSKKESGALSERVNLRIESQLLEYVKDLASKAGARDLSDYVRGLLIAESMTAKKDLTGISLPGWLIGNKVFISGEKTK